MIHPYAHGKIPVVFIHGLGATPQSWTRMITCLETNPVIRGHYQLWTFGYVSGQPILYSASLLRQALADVRKQYDPLKTDAAFDRMVLVGYSMGGILAKVMAEDSGNVLWDEISTRPARLLSGPPGARDVVLKEFFFKPVPEVRRIIFIATPHRGSEVDDGAIRWLGCWLNQPLDELRRIHNAIVSNNVPDFFRESFRGGVPSSVDQLAWKHPMLMALFKTRINPAVQFHSIIADLSDPPVPGGSDGFVPYASSHLEGAASELIVHSGHLCESNAQVIGECERILLESLESPERSAGTQSGRQR